MSKKTNVKKKIGTGLGALAPTKAPIVTPKAIDTEEQRGPRGGIPGKRIAITFRVTREQYRKLVEARLDAGGTIHELLSRAVAYYFDHEHGTKF